MACLKIPGVRCKEFLLRGKSCGDNSPVIREKAREHLKQKKCVVISDAREGALKKWDPDVSAVRKIFPD